MKFFIKMKSFMILFLLILTSVAFADNLSLTWFRKWTYESGAVQIRKPALKNLTHDEVLISTESNPNDVCKIFTNQEMDVGIISPVESVDPVKMVTINEKGERSEVKVTTNKKYINTLLCTSSKLPPKKCKAKKIIPHKNGTVTIRGLNVRGKSSKGESFSFRISTSSNRDGVCRMFGYKMATGNPKDVVTKIYTLEGEKDPREMAVVSPNGYIQNYMRTADRIFSIDCTNSELYPVHNPSLEEDDDTDADVLLIQRGKIIY